VVVSCKRRPPLAGWQRALADVVADLLLAHAREWHWAYWPRGIVELSREPSHVVVAGGSLPLVRRGQGAKALEVEVVELVHRLKHFVGDAVVHCSVLKRLIQLAE